MKKKIVLIQLMLILNFYSFSEIISWKGMEIGLSPDPKWLKSYLIRKDEKLLRKKFDVEKNQSIICGLGKADFLEEARTISQLDAQRKLEDKIGKKQRNLNFDFLYEYWLEDSESGYTVYSIYSYIISEQ